MMKEAMKKLVDFAGSWNLNLEIQYDVDLAGRRVYFMSMTSEEKRKIQTGSSSGWAGGCGAGVNRPQLKPAGIEAPEACLL
jgi:hypothetical protein